MTEKIYNDPERIEENKDLVIPRSLEVKDDPNAVAVVLPDAHHPEETVLDRVFPPERRRKDRFLKIHRNPRGGSPLGIRREFKDPVARPLAENDRNAGIVRVAPVAELLHLCRSSLLRSQRMDEKEKEEEDQGRSRLPSSWIVL